MTEILGNTRTQKLLFGLIVPICGLAAAELYMRLSDSYNTFAFAPPSQIAIQFYNELISGRLLDATGQTLSAALIGLCVGSFLGVAVGVIVGLIRPIDHILEVTMETLRTIPFIVLIPMLIMLLGIGMKLEVTSVAIGTFWPNFIMSRAAVRQIEPRLLEVAQVLGLSQFAALTKVLIPAVLPRLLVGFRMAMGFSLLGAVSVEVISNPQGVGNAMMMAQQSLHPGVMFAYLVWIAFLGWAMNAFVVFVEKRLLWRYLLTNSKS